MKQAMEPESYDSSTPGGLELGEALAWMVLGSPTWMLRRVESLRLEQDGSTRMRVSLDVVPPEPALRFGSRRAIIPLAMMEKGAVRQLDTSGPAGAPLPVLTAQENGALVVEMLLALAKRALPSAVASSSGCRAQVERVVYSDVADAEIVVAAFSGWLSAHGVQGDENEETAVFVAMVAKFATDFLLAVELERSQVGSRMVVKYSYEDQLPEIRRVRVPASLRLRVPNFAMASSVHVEVAAGPGIGVLGLSVQEIEPDGYRGNSWAARSSAGEPDTVLHVACRPSHRLMDARSDFRLTPPRRGLPTVTLWGALVTTVLLAAAIAHRAWPGVLLEPGAASASVAGSVLLVGPALMLSWLSRAPEHALIAQLLWPFRRVNRHGFDAASF